MQEIVERLLREQLVEDVRELAIRLDQRVVRPPGGGDSLVVGGVGLRSHDLPKSIGLGGVPLEPEGAAQADWET